MAEAGAAVVRLSGLRVDIEHDLSAALTRHGGGIAGGEPASPPSN